MRLTRLGHPSDTSARGGICDEFHGQTSDDTFETKNEQLCASSRLGILVE